ncbi:Hypothetical predicted protein [Prunus dulcis]|uniref:Uncharacterized protein n=1 Tax=Prunus dulcis TaxID=3755 RepID=A0A5E4EWY8_PRUDU|nr:hypothetical protein L3X38_008725 [Prunus dulcis]VVA20244.1 Hypothetical predicted protein [Prunus dulcis]
MAYARQAWELWIFVVLTSVYNFTESNIVLISSDEKHHSRSLSALAIDWTVSCKRQRVRVGEKQQVEESVVKKGSYVSRSEAGRPKLKAAFLSPNTSYRLALFFFVPLLISLHALLPT